MEHLLTVPWWEKEMKKSSATVIKYTWPVKKPISTNSSPRLDFRQNRTLIFFFKQIIIERPIPHVLNPHPIG
jgi:hypothetical protein